MKNGKTILLRNDTINENICVKKYEKKYVWNESIYNTIMYEDNILNWRNVIEESIMKTT